MSTSRENFSPILGRRLAELRSAKGLSQEQASKLFGISREMLGKYERGQASPGAEVLAAMQDNGIDIVYLLSGTTMMESQALLTPEEELVLAALRHSGEEVKRALLSIAALVPLQRTLGLSGLPTGKPSERIGSLVPDAETARMKPAEKRAHLQSKKKRDAS